jgi:RES domain-containing protein
MSHDHALLEALEGFGAADWSGRVWRHMFNSYPPQRVNVGGARWNPAGVGAIYTSLKRETALAEGQHAVDMQPLMTPARRTLYELEAEILEVVDLSDPARLLEVGIGQAELLSDDFGACQRVGAAAAWLGRGGLIVPSARHEGSNAVILVGSIQTHELTILSEEVVQS